MSAFYNQRRKAEQYIKEGKHAIKWTRLSCQKFRNNEVRLQLHARAYNLTNFMRTLALPRSMARWSLTTLREKLVKVGAKMVRHGRYVTFQMAEVAVSRWMFGQILARIARLRAPPVPVPQSVPWVLTSDTRSLKALQCLHDSRRPAFAPNAIDSLGRYSRMVTGSTMLSRVM